ncbi:NADH:ubiquinone oxidoreductase [Candidatus Gracilibacteria bacterium]|nr:NADH:ubiquinone oxidoreductase [Candidatus Gracilibacteria bacterium]
MKKPKVGIYGITGCMGCQLNILYQKELLDIIEAVDLRAFPAGKEKNIHDNLDLVFLEGVVVNEKDLRELKEIRKKTKILVAIGSCATDGCVPAIKNFMNNKNLEQSVYTKKELKQFQELNPMPIDAYVKVDAYLYGCPVDKQEFLQFIKQTFLGKEFRTYQKPICYKCNLQERGCLLEEGIECMGPVTFGNCSVMCPHENYACIGCRGPYKDANFEAYFKLLESKGIPKETIFNHLNRFAGVKFKQMIDKEVKEKKINPLIPAPK